MIVSIVLLCSSFSPSALAEDEGPRALSDQGRDNLVVFARLYGLVRYFHPSYESSELDWERFAIEGIRKVEEAPEAFDLAEILSELYFDIAPGVEIWAGTPEEAPEPPSKPSGATHRVGWFHVGLGPELAQPGYEGGRRNIYQSQRVEESLGSSEESRLAPEGTVRVVDLGSGVCCRVPITLWADASGTFPRGGEALEYDDGWKPSARDRATRLASVAITYNIVEHFYPYMDITDVDWDEEFRTALSRAALDEDGKEFEETLSRFFARIQDGHGNVYANRRAAEWGLPFAATFVGDALVVTHVPEELGSESVRRGDRLLTINGSSVEERFEKASKTICTATEGWLRHKAVSYVLKVEKQTPAVVTLMRNGERLALEVPPWTSSQAYGIQEPRPANGQELAPGIRYFDLNRTQTEELERVLPVLARADGVVFDLRGYPGSAGADLMPYLCDDTIHSAWWNTPVYRLPSQESVEFARSHWTLEPKEPRLPDNIAFLTDGRAISYAESCMGIVEHYRLGEIVGAPTAGSNGNINRATVPAGFMLIWTGMKVTKHDDSQHHGVGNLPTVPMTRTIEGIRDGKDELLDKAVEILQAKSSQ